MKVFRGRFCGAVRLDCGLLKLLLSAVHDPVDIERAGDRGIDRELQLWGDHAIKGTPGADIIPELGPAPTDYIVPKRRYSGFFQTDLDILLKELGVKTVIISGLHTHMCCRHTSADAYCLGYDVVAAKEATNAFTEEDYLGGLAYLKTCYGADAYSNDELIAAF